jgi:hypothetical protein
MNPTDNKILDECLTRIRQNPTLSTMIEQWNYIVKFYNKPMNSYDMATLVPYYGNSNSPYDSLLALVEAKTKIMVLQKRLLEYPIMLKCLAEISNIDSTLPVDWLKELVGDVLTVNVLFKKEEQEGVVKYSLVPV